MARAGFGLYTASQPQLIVLGLTGPTAARLLYHVPMTTSRIVVVAVVAALVVFVHAVVPVRTPAERMSSAAAAFIATLNEDQQKTAMFPFDDARRLEWSFVPKNRPGLRLDAMTDMQREAAQALLRTAFSSQGYLKVNAILALEETLRDLEIADGGTGASRVPGAFYLAFFGTPAQDIWMWRFEGHHISVNITVGPGESVAVTPMFMGSNPATIPEGPRQGFQVLADEEELGFELVNSMTPEQRSRVVISTTAPPEILLVPGKTFEDLDPAKRGLEATYMTPDQLRLLGDLVGVYVNNLEADAARIWLERIGSADPSEIFFAWAGGLRPGEPHYYCLQGPGFAFELDNTQNGANHTHTVWRDKDADFGADALARHLQTEHGD